MHLYSQPAFSLWLWTFVGILFTVIAFVITHYHCWQEVEDLERQLRLMTDVAAAPVAANGTRQVTINDKGRSNKITAQSIARKVRYASTHVMATQGCERLSSLAI